MAQPNLRLVHALEDNFGVWGPRFPTSGAAGQRAGWRGAGVSKFVLKEVPQLDAAFDPFFGCRGIRCCKQLLLSRTCRAPKDALARTIVQGLRAGQGGAQVSRRGGRRKSWTGLALWADLPAWG